MQCTELVAFAEARKVSNELRLEIGEIVAHHREGSVALPVATENGIPTMFEIVPVGQFVYSVDEETVRLSVALDRMEAALLANRVQAIIGATEINCIQTEEVQVNEDVSRKFGNSSAGADGPNGKEGPNADGHTSE